MRLAKWGNSLAVRIPAAIVKELRIGPDEDVEIKVTGENSFVVSRDRRRLDAIEKMRRLAVALPPGYKFNREEIYDRFDRNGMGKDLETRSNPDRDGQCVRIDFWIRTFWSTPTLKEIERQSPGRSCLKAGWLVCR